MTRHIVYDGAGLYHWKWNQLKMLLFQRNWEYILIYNAWKDSNIARRRRIFLNFLTFEPNFLRNFQPPGLFCDPRYANPPWSQNFWDPPRGKKTQKVHPPLELGGHDTMRIMRAKRARVANRYYRPIIIADNLGKNPYRLSR